MTNIRLDCNYDKHINFNGNSVNGTAWVLIDDIAVEFSFKCKLDHDHWEDYDGVWVDEITDLYDFEISAGDAWLVDENGDTINEVTYELQPEHKAAVIEALEQAVYQEEAA